MNTTPKRASLLERLLRSPRIEEALAEAEREERENVAADRAALIAERARVLEDLGAAARLAEAELSAAEKLVDRARAELAAAEGVRHGARLAGMEARRPLESRLAVLEGRLIASAPAALAEARAALLDEHDRLRRIKPEVRKAFRHFEHGDRVSRPVYDVATNAGSIADALAKVTQAARALEAAGLTCASDEEAERLAEELRAGVPKIESPTLPGEDAAFP